MTTIRTEPCGCRVVRENGCGVHIEWCSLHAAAGELREACETTVEASDFNDSQLARWAVEYSRSALAKARGTGICPHCGQNYRTFHQWDDLETCPLCGKPTKRREE